MLAMKQYQKAFTLIELMVTLTLLAVLMLLAAPSFRDFQRTSMLATQTNSFISALYAAKNEAIKRNVPSYITPLDAAWSSGWRVYADLNFNAQYDSATDYLVLENSDVPAIINLEGTNSAIASPPYISFNGSGFPVTKDGGPENLSLGLKIDGLSGADEIRNTRFILISRAGSIRSCKPVSSNDSNCKSSLSN